MGRWFRDAQADRLEHPTTAGNGPPTGRGHSGYPNIWALLNAPPQKLNCLTILVGRAKPWLAAKPDGKAALFSGQVCEIAVVRGLGIKNERISIWPVVGGKSDDVNVLKFKAREDGWSRGKREQRDNKEVLEAVHSREIKP